MLGENNRWYAGASGAPFATIGEKWKNFVANEAKDVVFGVATLHGAFSEQSDWPVLIAFFHAHRNFIKQQAQPPIKYVVAD